MTRRRRILAEFAVLCFDREASVKVRKGNDERLFDEGRRRVRAWETANAPSL
jgi:hypothetical protein